MKGDDEAQLATAISRVRHDVEVTLGADAVLIEVSTGTSPEVSIATNEVTPFLTGLHLHPGETEPELVTRLADTVQDCLAESRRWWGRAWPPCPDPSHHHPLSAPYASPGSWVCPSSGEAVAPIGGLERP